MLVTTGSTALGIPVPGNLLANLALPLSLRPSRTSPRSCFSLRPAGNRLLARPRLLMSDDSFEKPGVVSPYFRARSRGQHTAPEPGKRKAVVAVEQASHSEREAKKKSKKAEPTEAPLVISSDVSDSAPALLPIIPSSSFAERALRFFISISIPDSIRLPPRVSALNPYRDPEVVRVMGLYLSRFYSQPDVQKRVILLGINPSRFGAAITGIPFTDAPALKTRFEIDSTLKGGREPSGEYVWKVIQSMGGMEPFGRCYWINSLFPLALVKDGKNYNFYDDPRTLAALKPFIAENVRKQIALGMYSEAAICLGAGTNFKFLQELNKEHGFFGRLFSLEHPRFILQYKKKETEAYIDKYKHILGRAFATCEGETPPPS